MRLNVRCGRGGKQSYPPQRPALDLVLDEPTSPVGPSLSSTPGERIWPRYPRGIDARADHRQARKYVDEGVLSPTSRWQLSDAA